MDPPALSPTFLLTQAQQRLRFGQALDACIVLRDLLQREPGCVEALELLGKALLALGETRQAARLMCQAYVRQPAHQQTARMRGIAYYVLDDLQSARAVYREWLEAEPGNATATHLLAAVSGEAVPDRASDAYLRETFDAFAPHFDQNLHSLSYCVPRDMVQLLRQYHAPDASWTVLDAGCGTGLLGRALQPWAHQLHGVDISEKMVERARATGSYSALTVCELGDYLERSGACFDLIAFADTLIYFGDLNAIVQRAAQRLKPGAWLLFNTELLDADAQPESAAVRLRASGRYQHSPAHVAQCLRRANLELLACLSTDVRMELGQRVPGQLALARRA